MSFEAWHPGRRCKEPGRRMALPDFLIIGAQKCGTTWLADQLGRHPRSSWPPRRFTSSTRQTISTEEWAGTKKEHFTGGQGRLIGKTPDYLWTGSEGAEGHVADAHRRLHGVLPEAKLIIVVRNPVDRAMSALTHLIRTRRVSPLHAVDALLWVTNRGSSTVTASWRKGCTINSFALMPSYSPRNSCSS